MRSQSTPGPLVIVETHPVQYHAPVYRRVSDQCDAQVHVVYGSDFSIAGYHDREFGTSFAWDSGLVQAGDACTFLSRVRDGGATGFDQVSAKGIGRAFRALQPRAVLLTGYRERFHLAVLVQALRLGCPVLYRAETTDHAVERTPLKQWLRNGSLRLLYGRFDALLPIGQRSRDHYLRLGCSHERLYASPYCVDPSPFRCAEAHRAVMRDAARAELGVSTDTFIVLFSGKLSQRKGPQVLVEALGTLSCERRRLVRLVFVGDGREREALNAQAQDAGVAATFLGFKNQSELSPVYHAADVLVLPSLESETWGLVVNEALHHGVPAIVSDRVGCAPDLIDPDVTGYTVPAGSASALGQAVSRAFARLHGEETRSACRDRVREYSVSKAAAGIAAALQGAEASRRNLS